MWIDLVILFTKAFVLINAVLILASFLTWMERKQSAVMQDRLGANRAPIFGVRAFGLPHILADALKMLFKEDYVPPGGDRLLHTVAPLAAVFFALMSFAAIPFGDAIRVGSREIKLQVLELDVGLLFVFAMMSMGIYGTFLAGFSSNNKFAFLGGLRASSQMISYEITMGATLVGLLMIFKTLDLNQIVREQRRLPFPLGNDSLSIIRERNDPAGRIFRDQGSVRLLADASYSLDFAALSLRPVDASGLEDPASSLCGQYLPHRLFSHSPAVPLISDCGFGINGQLRL